MTKIWLRNLLTFYVDDHVWISRKLVHRCFMLSLSFQGGLFNLLGFVVEQNSAMNSLRGTRRKKEARWCRKVILVCIATNAHVNEHVCVHLFVQLKKSIFWGKISEKPIYTLSSSWFHWNSGNPTPLKSWLFLYSQNKGTVGTIHILHLNLLI